MNGYGETLRALAERLGVRYETTPPAQSRKLLPFLRERIAVLDRVLPHDAHPRNVSVRRSLVVGLLSQDSGLPDYADVQLTHTMERLAAALEYGCNCPEGENAMGRVIRTDRRGREIVTPADLARPLQSLVDETVHAGKVHLPRIVANLDHCPSLWPEVNAIRLLEGALPAALRFLVGDGNDDVKEAAGWILSDG